MSKELTNQMKRHEGFRAKVYVDTTGHKTIGYGFNLDAGMSENTAEALLQSQLAEVWLDCNREFHSFWWRLSRPRQCVLINMVFNMGMEGVKRFKKMIKAISEGDDERVVLEMLDSRWARQVGNRANELAYQWQQDGFLSDEDLNKVWGE